MPHSLLWGVSLNRLERKGIARHRIEGVRDVLEAIYEKDDYFVTESGENGVKFVYPNKSSLRTVRHAIARIDANATGSAFNPTVTLFLGNFESDSAERAFEFKREVLDRKGILCGMDLCNAVEYLGCLKEYAF